MMRAIVLLFCLGAGLLRAESRYAGAWEGKTDNRPAVRLDLGADGGGTLTLYVYRDGRLNGKTVCRIRNAKLDDGRLDFVISREEAMLGEGTAEIPFEVRLRGEGAAELEGAGARLDLVRLAPWAGTWRGRLRDDPGVDLELAGDGTGKITFYFIMLGDDGTKTVTPHTTPLLEPKLAGNVLTFEVEHARQHGGSERGPNVRFRVEFTSEREARITRLDGSAGDETSEIRLLRER